MKTGHDEWATYHRWAIVPRDPLNIYCLSCVRMSVYPWACSSVLCVLYVASSPTKRDPLAAGSAPGEPLEEWRRAKTRLSIRASF